MRGAGAAAAPGERRAGADRRGHAGGEGRRVDRLPGESGVRLHHDGNRDERPAWPATSADERVVGRDAVHPHRGGAVAPERLQELLAGRSVERGHPARSGDEERRHHHRKAGPSTRGEGGPGLPEVELRLEPEQVRPGRGERPEGPLVALRDGGRGEGGGPGRTRPVAPTQPATRRGRADRASATARRATSAGSRDGCTRVEPGQVEGAGEEQFRAGGHVAPVDRLHLPGALDHPVPRGGRRRGGPGRGAPCPWRRRGGGRDRPAPAGSTELHGLEVARDVDRPAARGDAGRLRREGRGLPVDAEGPARRRGEPRRASASPRRGRRGPRTRTGSPPGPAPGRRSRGCGRTAAPFCRLHPRVPTAWKPTRRTVVEGSGRRRSRWCRTRPPVAIPEAETMMHGP